MKNFIAILFAAFLMFVVNDSKAPPGIVSEDIIIENQTLPAIADQVNSFELNNQVYCMSDINRFTTIKTYESVNSDTEKEIKSETVIKIPAEKPFDSNIYKQNFNRLQLIRYHDRIVTQPYRIIANNDIYSKVDSFHIYGLVNS